MNVPDFALPILTIFQPAFSTPTYNRFLVLLLGALLTTGRRTITNVLRTVRQQAPGHVSSYHRVFSQRHWSTWTLARGVMTFLLNHVVPPGPVFLAGDDTVAEHPGPKVLGKGRHRDGVRSTHSYTAYRWGHKWVVVSVLVTLPCATRPWALPVLVALYRAPEWDQAHKTRHKTPAHIARLLLARCIRWFPERQCIFVGDTGYGTSETARFCRKYHHHLTLISKLYGDAACTSRLLQACRPHWASHESKAQSSPLRKRSSPRLHSVRNSPRGGMAALREPSQWSPALATGIGSAKPWLKSVGCMSMIGQAHIGTSISLPLRSHSVRNRSWRGTPNGGPLKRRSRNAGNISNWNPPSVTASTVSSGASPVCLGYT
jgi:DDE superfamily endonuclease